MSPICQYECGFSSLGSELKNCLVWKSEGGCEKRVGKNWPGWFILPSLFNRWLDFGKVNSRDTIFRSIKAVDIGGGGGGVLQKGKSQLLKTKTNNWGLGEIMKPKEERGERGEDESLMEGSADLVFGEEDGKGNGALGEDGFEIADGRNLFLGRIL